VKIKANADQHAQDLRPIIRDIHDAGITSARAIADELTKRGVLTSRGGGVAPDAVLDFIRREPEEPIPDAPDPRCLGVNNGGPIVA
jgi:hypothetical protein